jgi:hypothetical protein
VPGYTQVDETRCYAKVCLSITASTASIGLLCSDTVDAQQLAACQLGDIFTGRIDDKNAG